VAQFGRGALADISEKIIAQFADNLNTLIDKEGGAAAPSLSAATSAPAVGQITDASTDKPTVRKIEGPAAEPLNLQALAGGAMLKRLLPIVGAFLGIFMFFGRRRRRRQS
jgi:hypothetical protein